MILVSFDIDGTLEGGEPPGPVSFEFVRQAATLGAVVGSSSDRTLTDQRGFWRACQVRVDFCVLKHHLPRLREGYPDHRYVHIGDSMMDEYYARLAGFVFWNSRSLACCAARQRLTPSVVTERLIRRLAQLAR